MRPLYAVRDDGTKVRMGDKDSNYYELFNHGVYLHMLRPNERHICDAINGMLDAEAADAKLDEILCEIAAMKLADARAPT